MTEGVVKRAAMVYSGLFILKNPEIQKLDKLGAPKGLNFEPAHNGIKLISHFFQILGTEINLFTAC